MLAPYTVRGHAQAYVKAEVLRLSELQPNTRPFMNVAGDVVLTRHMDIRCCLFVKLARGQSFCAAPPPSKLVDECMLCANADPSNADAKRVCDHTCQYAAYVEQSRALGDDHAQPSLFRSIYLNVLNK